VCVCVCAFDHLYLYTLIYLSVYLAKSHLSISTQISIPPSPSATSLAIMSASPATIKPIRYVDSRTGVQRSVSSTSTSISNATKVHRALHLFESLKSTFSDATSTGIHTTPPLQSQKSSTPAPDTSTSAITITGAAAAATANSTPLPRPLLGGSPTADEEMKAVMSSNGDTLLLNHTYTESELLGMTKAELARQLRVVMAVSRRLLQRNQKLAAELQRGSGEKERASSQQQHNPSSSLGSCQPPLSQMAPAEEIISTVPCASPSPLTMPLLSTADLSPEATQPAGDVNSQVAALEAEVLRLGRHKERLTARLYKAEKEVRRLKTASGSHPEDPLLVTSPPPPLERAKNSSCHQPSGLCTVLRDQIKTMEYRLTQSEERAGKAMQLQLDALLSYSGSGSSDAAVSKSLVDQEVQRLFQLLQQQLVTEAAMHQTERARLNELLYLMEGGGTSFAQRA